MDIEERPDEDGSLNPPHSIRIFKAVGSGANAQSFGCKDQIPVQHRSTNLPSQFMKSGRCYLKHWLAGLASAKILLPAFSHSLARRRQMPLVLDVLRLKLRRNPVKRPLDALAAKIDRLLDEYAKSPRCGINAMGGMGCE